MSPERKSDDRPLKGPALLFVAASAPLSLHEKRCEYAACGGDEMNVLRSILCVEPAASKDENLMTETTSSLLGSMISGVDGDIVASEPAVSLLRLDARTSARRATEPRGALLFAGGER
jgi:hypothetical protein